MLEVAVEDSQVTVSVSDTGPGIPIADQALIFTEFGRSERTIERGYGGLGLGLAICKQFVELHGGTIGVRSSGEEGSGATFFFTLPTIAADPALPEPSPLPALAHEQPIAFLAGRAEDDASLAAYLADRGLETRVCRVDVETDWLPRLLAAPPGVIIIDTQLAAHQGWQILAALQRHPATEHIPLVVCALDPRHRQGALLELQYQRKPLDAAQLARVLIDQGVLDNDRADAKTILIVDDDPGTLAMHARLLRQQSAQYRVLEARNGHEALAVLRQTRPDLVLLDLLMPKLDGFGLLEAMRAMETTRDVPVVVLTAQMLTEAEMERLNRGVATVLSKGVFSAAEIMAHVEAALARKRGLGSPTQWLVRKAIAFIHAHYAEPLARGQIAQYVGISADYLTECFHQELGVTPIAYLNRYRIHQAQALFEAGDRSVTEVALTVRFSDSNHFSRMFQREVGMTPCAYRSGRRAAVGD